MFWTAIGIGLGIGIVHTAVLLTVMVLARRSAKTEANDTVGLMRERNEIDRQKVLALNLIAEYLGMDTAR